MIHSIKINPVLVYDLQMFFWWDHWQSIINYTTNSWLFTWFDFLPNLTPFLDLTPSFHVLSLVWLLTEFDMTENRIPWGICNGFGMLIGDAYPSGHLVLSHFETGCVLMLRPISPELVLFPDFWVSNIPRYFFFAFKTFLSTQVYLSLQCEAPWQLG